MFFGVLVFFSDFFTSFTRQRKLKKNSCLCNSVRILGNVIAFPNIQIQSDITFTQSRCAL